MEVKRHLSLSEDDSRAIEQLLERIEAGTVALFAGAGMSANSGAPVGLKLAEELCARFAPDLSPQLGLQAVADRLQSRQGIDRLDIDAWIAERLDPLQPATLHKTIAQFSWPAIFTTNYDRLIEKGYDREIEKAQRLQVVPNSRDEYDLTDSRVVSLFKVNGCISRLQDPEAPLVVSKSDFRRTTESRQKTLRRLADLQRTRTWLFVGYSFRDDIIIELLDDLAKSIGESQVRWSYALLPNIDEYDRDYLKQYRVHVIPLPAEDFFELLSRKVNKSVDLPSSPKTARRDILDIVDLELNRQFEIFNPNSAVQPSAGFFYRGNLPTWRDLYLELDVRREQADFLESSARQILDRGWDPKEDATGTMVITGTAGTGKSTVLRRLGFDLTNTIGIPFLIAREGVQWDAQRIIQYSRQVKRPIMVLFDSVDSDYQRLRSIIRSLSQQNIPALIMVGARIGSWTTASRRWGPIAVDHVVQLSEHFSSGEVRELVAKLARNGVIAINAITSESYWLNRAAAAQRVALVVMLELVQQGRFEEILLSEYQGLQDSLAEESYKVVSIIHEFGTPIQRELLRRVLECRWEDFIERVLQGAATNVVIEDYETETGRGFYRSKHPVIAQLIRENTVEDPAALIAKVFEAVDPADRSDVAMVRTMLKRGHLADLLNTIEAQRYVFEAALRQMPDDVVVRHQLGINEMDQGYLEEARLAFETCLDIEPENMAVIHTFGSLEWERAKRTPEGPLRELLYGKALARFNHVVRKDRHSEYGYHSIAALYLNRAKYDRTNAIDQWVVAADALEVVDLGIAETDDKEAGRLHDLRGQILELLHESEEARWEYEKRIDQGLATSTTFYLLAKLNMVDNRFDEAERLVMVGLSAFAEDKRLLALRADLTTRKPEVSRGIVLEVLAPAVRANPDRLSLRFPYAVALYESGITIEAATQFRKTRTLSAGIFARGRARSTFMSPSATPIRFQGRVVRASQQGRALRIRRSDNQDDVYFNIERALQSGTKVGDYVTFEIGFSYTGTIALNIEVLNPSSLPKY